MLDRSASAFILLGDLSKCTFGMCLQQTVLYLIRFFFYSYIKAIELLWTVCFVLKELFIFLLQNLCLWCLWKHHPEPFVTWTFW